MLLTEDTILQNRYRIDGLLARGGMGAIYRAFDTNLNIPVAVKENFFDTPEAVAQFKQEALILARLKHPNLPRVIHHFTSQHPQSGERRQYLVMDFIEGQDLWEVVQQRGRPLEEAEALKVILQICQAVSYLHQQKPPIIHRDIKPQNIKITPHGEAVLVDFGIAKQVTGDSSRTHLGARGVTPGYSSPEQYTRKGTTPASDIYSLGATLFAILTGQRPPDSMSLLLDRASLPPPHTLNPRLSAQVSQAILHAMALEPARRPPSVEAWQKELAQILSSQTPEPEAEDDDTLFITSATRPGERTIAEPEEAPAFWLVDASGLGHPVGGKTLTIGRHSECDIVLHDLSVSRIHAHLRLESGRCMVQDSGSANGTFINGKRLGPDWYPLQPGDTLAIGTARFYLTTTRPARVATPSSAVQARSRVLPGTQPAPRKQPSTRRRGGWIGLAVLLVILLAGAAGVYVLLQNRGTISQQPTPTIRPATPTASAAGAAGGTAPT
ncbi:MAG: FHA domain-containing protein, partial [Chloroflexi bacterium]